MSALTSPRQYAAWQALRALEATDAIVAVLEAALVHIPAGRVRRHYRPRAPAAAPEQAAIVDEQIRELHRLGLIDLEIADRLGLHRTVVGSRRRTLQLPPNGRPGPRLKPLGSTP